MSFALKSRLRFFSLAASCKIASVKSESAFFIVFLAIALAWAGAAAVGHHWWTYNRMSVSCLVDGMWGEDGGPGYEQQLERLSNRRLESVRAEVAATILNDRGYILYRHSPAEHWTCGPLDAGMHWAQIQKLAKEQDWREANFWLALKFGYGYFYDKPLVRVVDEEAVVFNHLRTPLDLQQFEKSFALLRSFALLQHSVEQNQTWAQYLSKNVGDGESLDLQKSFALLRRSAEQGEIRAQYLLAEAYLTGEWGKDGAMQVEVNRELARKWLNKAVTSYNRPYVTPLSDS